MVIHANRNDMVKKALPCYVIDSTWDKLIKWYQVHDSITPTKGTIKI